MKLLVIDTNVLIDFCQKPKDFSRSKIASYDRLLIPSTVLGEFKAGIFANKRGEESSARLQELLSCESVKVVPITDQTAELYAKLYQALSSQGRMIPQNDMWIAASVLENGADLVSMDDHFRFVPMLTVINP